MISSSLLPHNDMASNAANQVRGTESTQVATNACALPQIVPKLTSTTLEEVLGEKSFTKMILNKNESILLRKAVKRATGIYAKLHSAPSSNSNSDAADDFHPSKAILVVSVNAAYFKCKFLTYAYGQICSFFFITYYYTFCAVFQNWVCHVERLGLKYLAWADDEKASDLISSFLSTSDHASYGTHMSSSSMSQDLGIQSYEVRWKQRQAFNAISTYKLMQVRLILEMGVNVWFSDVDIVFVKDPWPLLRHHNACDYTFQSNNFGREFHESEANSGFHILRSNSRIHDVLNRALKTAEVHSTFSDQWALWDALLRTDHVTVPPLSNTEPTVSSACADAQNILRLCPLPTRTFAVGQHPESVNLTEVAVLHANWVVGRQLKYEMLSKWGVWALSPDFDNPDSVENCAPTESLAHFVPVASS
jgi:hypothetical protein